MIRNVDFQLKTVDGEQKRNVPLPIGLVKSAQQHKDKLKVEVVGPKNKSVEKYGFAIFHVDSKGTRHDVVCAPMMFSKPHAEEMGAQLIQKIVRLALP